jgi:hypothetical protein
VELVAQPRALADDGLQPAGHLAEGAEFEGQGRVAAGLFGQREPSGRTGLDGVGLFTTKESGPVVFVALRVAAGEGEREGGRRVGRRGGRPGEAMQEVEQVVGILAGRSEADEEVDGAVVLDQALEALAEPGVAGGRLGEWQLGGGGLAILAEEGGLVPVARGVDADAAAARRWRSGSVLW